MKPDSLRTRPVHIEEVANVAVCLYSPANMLAHAWFAARHGCHCIRSTLPRLLNASKMAIERRRAEEEHRQRILEALFGVKR